METLWRIEMLGGLRAMQGDRVLTRFRSHKTGALLAYLAFYPHRSHPRDLLTDLLWPDDPLDAARMKLRTALASLRRQLEPPGVPAGAVIVASRLAVRLNPDAVATDVAAVRGRAPGGGARHRYRPTAHALDAGHRAVPRTAAAGLLRGLGPARAAAVERRSTCRHCGRLFCALEQAGDLDRALTYAGRAVAVEPLREEAHQELIRLYAAAGQQAAAQQPISGAGTAPPRGVGRGPLCRDPRAG